MRPVTALATARSIGAVIPSRRAITLLEGYELGRALEMERFAGGWHRVVWMLGFTNQDLWAALGLDQPFRAPVYAETLAPDRIEADGPITATSRAPEYLWLRNGDVGGRPVCLPRDCNARPNSV